jgi:hypothetical protein
MSWIYEQLTGNLIDPTGELQGKGYSGQPPHVNDADSQEMANWGPIPEGLWQAVELIPESKTHGPYAIRLEPYPETETFGRSGFLMHGDSVIHPGFASDGCIIQSRDVREMFWNGRNWSLAYEDIHGIKQWNSVDHDLQVVRGGAQVAPGSILTP